MSSLATKHFQGNLLPLSAPLASACFLLFTSPTSSPNQPSPTHFESTQLLAATLDDLSTTLPPRWGSRLTCECHDDLDGEAMADLCIATSPTLVRDLLIPRELLRWHVLTDPSGNSDSANKTGKLHRQ